MLYVFYIAIPVKLIDKALGAKVRGNTRKQGCLAPSTLVQILDNPVKLIDKAAARCEAIPVNDLIRMG